MILNRNTDHIYLRPIPPSRRPKFGPRNKPGPKPIWILNSREIELSRLVATGIADKEIAARMGLTHATVKVYVCRILSKLHLENRTQLALYVHGCL